VKDLARIATSLKREPHRYRGFLQMNDLAAQTKRPPGNVGGLFFKGE
jgi:hypothetical protein